VVGSDASHRYDIIGDRALYILCLAEVYLGSRVHYIGTDDEVQYLLIEGNASDQGMGGGLGPLWPSPLKINSNTIHKINQELFLLLKNYV
jgi:hypothetical protein